MCRKVIRQAYCRHKNNRTIAQEPQMIIGIVDIVSVGKERYFFDYSPINLGPYIPLDTISTLDIQNVKFVNNFTSKQRISKHN
uniref:Uncharacterized protein n=1 Tax=Rhizophora mucronata TaxID=61149 RepID=A0A2P2K996_RHIMU